MDEKKTFFTMMEELENYHLIKDVGMIPYYMYKLCNYDSYLVSYGKADEQFSYLKTNVKGLKLETRKKYTGNSIIDGCIWLIKNAQRVDVLNLYHYKLSTFIWIIIYKIFHYKGKVYLKLDIKAEDGKKMKMKKGSFKWILTKSILGKCKVISCETEYFKNYANRNWPILLKFIPNGVGEKDIDLTGCKEKIILSVGRLGTYQKATEIILEAFARAQSEISRDWKLVLIGSMESDFAEKFREQMALDEQLKERVNYLGIIEDRGVLNSWYKKSSIFVLPSRWESFGIAALEALAKGDYLLLTDLISYNEISNNGQFGKLFKIDDIEELSRKMIETCQLFEKNKLPEELGTIEDFIKNRYCWEKICRDLDICLSY